MEKRKTVHLLCITALMIFFFSCQKHVETPDTSATPDEILGTPPPIMPTYCRIESIWEHPGQSDQKFILVLYDEFENPIIVTQPNVGTGHPYRTFKYDQLHRLRQYRGEYANGNYEFWHFYGLDLNGRIGVDTQYVLGAMGPTGPLSYFERTIHQYTYDAQGRIIKVVSDQQLNPSHTETNYSYDAAGNLVYPPAWGVVYDNKRNYNRTNDIWQFLNRDYSMNNPFMATAYNATNYPTSINSNNPPLSFLNEFDIDHSQIGYGCRPSHW